MLGESTTSKILSHPTAYGATGGSGTVILGWVSRVDWIAIIGVTVLVATFVANLIFRRREDRRQQEQHEANMKLLNSKIPHK